MKKMTCLMSILVIAGCATRYEFNHRSTYINQPRLQLAPGLSGSKLTEDAYPIPFANEGNGELKPAASLVPPGSNISVPRKK